MIYQLVEDESGPDAGDVTFHSQRSHQLAAGTIVLFGFGFLCGSYCEPKATGAVLAVCSYGLGALFLLGSGLKTQITFHRDAQQMEVSWTFFGSSIIAHFHPYGEVGIVAREFAVAPGVGRTNLGYRMSMGYAAQVGHSWYLLQLPAGIPVTEAHLEALRQQLGFRQESQREPDATARP